MPGGAGDAALLDAVRGAYALAARMRDQFATPTDDVYGPAGDQMAAVVRAIARAMIAEAEALEQDIRSGQDVDLESVVSLRVRVERAEELHALLDQATRQVIHPVLGPTVLRELQRFEVPWQALVSATRERTYELMPIHRGDLAGLVDENDLDGYEWPLLVFRVPLRPMDWPLYHVLIYHEIGHALYEADAFRVDIPDALEPGQDASMTEKMQKEALAGDYVEAMGAWCEEIFADAVGVLLAGPAYALGLCRFLGTMFSFDAPTRTHPPLYLRIQLATELLRRIDIWEALSGPVQDILREWEARALAIQSPRTDGLDRDFSQLVPLLASGLLAAHDDIVERAHERVGSRAYGPDDVREDQDRGRRLQQRGIPPIEAEDQPSLTDAGTPLPASRVLAAVWSAYLHDAAAGLSTKDLGKKGEQYAHVLLGALDATEAIQLWKELK